MKQRQSDLFGIKSTFAAKIEERIKSNKAGFFRVSDISSALDVSNKKVIAWIEEGRLPAVDMNKGCDLRCMYRLTFEDVMAFAKSLDAGI
jgi:hypothetical protein